MFKSCKTLRKFTYVEWCTRLNPGIWPALLFFDTANSQTLQVNSQASELSSALSWPFVVSVLSVEKEGGQLSSSTNHGNHSILAGEGNSSQVKHDMFSVSIKYFMESQFLRVPNACMERIYILNVYCIVIYSSVIHIHILYAFAGGPITDFTHVYTCCVSTRRVRHAAGAWQ